MRLRLPKLTYANVVSTICLFILLGGGAYAATKLPKNSVGPKQLRKNAVRGAKVKNRSLTRLDIRGPVDSASSAGEAAHAARADQATVADQLVGFDANAFQPKKVQVYAPDVLGGEPFDLTPDVTGLSVLVMQVQVPAVMGEVGKPSFTGGVEGQRLTIISVNLSVIFSDRPDLKLVGGTWNGEKNDSLTLVLADGVWYETSRANL